MRRVGHWIHDRVRATLYAIISILPSWKAWTMVAVVAMLGWGVYRYLATRHEIALEINGHRLSYLSHQTSAEGVLRETGITLNPDDTLDTPAPRDLVEGAAIVINLARPVIIVHDGQAQEIRTHALDIESALTEAGVSLADGDRITMDDELAFQGSLLVPALLPDRGGIREIVAAIRSPLYLNIERALPIHIVDNGADRAIQVFGRTVASALWEAEITLYEGDRVIPSLAEPLTRDMTVTIERSMPVVLDVGGTARRLRTREKSVAGLIEEQSVSMGELDYVLPGPETSIARDLLVAVVRVLDEYLVEEIPISYEIRYEPDADAEIDTGHIVSWGQEGARRQLIHIRYENQEQTWRQVDDEWIARDPEDRVIQYGTKIVIRKMDTPEGPITYWRKLRMLATSYNAPTAGKPMDHPNYAITRIGLRAAKGIIAVDPRVINLRQDMYVPGYGLGFAGDTGGAIKWRRIDLCYDDDNLILWKKWVDVYLLTPVPDPEEINWIITNYPVERE